MHKYKKCVEAIFMGLLTILITIFSLVILIVFIDMLGKTFLVFLAVGILIVYWIGFSLDYYHNAEN